MTLRSCFAQLNTSHNFCPHPNSGTLRITLTEHPAMQKCVLALTLRAVTAWPLQTSAINSPAFISSTWIVNSTVQRHFFFFFFFFKALREFQTGLECIRRALNRALVLCCSTLRPAPFISPPALLTYLKPDCAGQSWPRRPYLQQRLI